MSDLSTHTMTIKKPFNGWLETHIGLLDIHVYLYVGSDESMRASLRADNGYFCSESLMSYRETAYKALCENLSTFPSAFPLTEIGSEYPQMAYLVRLNAFRGTVDSVSNLSKVIMETSLNIATDNTEKGKDITSLAVKVHRFLLHEFLDQLQTKGHVPLMRSWHGGCELKYLAP